MPALAAYRHCVAAPAGQCVGQGQVRVQALPPLVEYDFSQVGAEPHHAGIRGEYARQQVEQGRFAGAVRADNADPVASHDPHRKFPQDRVIAIGFGDALRGRDEATGQIGLCRFEPDVPCRAAVLSTPAAQRLQIAEPPLVACAPRGHAVAQPILLHRDLAAELVLFAGFLFEDRVAPRLEGGKTLVQHARDAAVEPYRASREPFEQPAVMADQHNAATHPGQLPLQPLDTGQVEMIGRLVEQQDIGRRRHRPCQSGAARLAAGQGCRVLVA